MNKFLVAGFCLLLGIVAMGAGTVVNTPGVPPGAIMAFGMATCPQGWISADGTNKLKATYPALNTALSTTWGAGDASNFTLPDLRGVFPKGAGPPVRTAGKDAAGAFYTATLGAYDTDKFQGHNHVLNVNSSESGNSQYPGDNYLAVGPSASFYKSNTNYTNQNAVGAVRSGTYSARVSNLTEPQSAAVTYCIKY